MNTGINSMILGAIRQAHTPYMGRKVSTVRESKLNQTGDSASGSKLPATNSKAFWTCKYCKSAGEGSTNKNPWQRLTPWALCNHLQEFAFGGTSRRG